MNTLQTRIQDLCQAGRCPAQTIQASMAQTGKPAVGCFPLFVPEELVYAAGFLPVGLWGGVSAFQKSNKYIQSFACSILRANLEKLERRDPDGFSTEKSGGRDKNDL